MGADQSVETRIDAVRLFDPVRIGGLEVRNRLAVAPMTRVSATDAGHPTERMAEYYGAFAEGGFGLLITEGIYTDRCWSQPDLGRTLYAQRRCRSEADFVSPRRC